MSQFWFKVWDLDWDSIFTFFPMYIQLLQHRLLRLSFWTSLVVPWLRLCESTTGRPLALWPLLQGPCCCGIMRPTLANGLWEEMTCYFQSQRRAPPHNLSVARATKENNYLRSCPCKSGCLHLLLSCMGEESPTNPYWTCSVIKKPNFVTISH